MVKLNFGPLQSLISNISGTGQHIQNRKMIQSMAIPSAYDEKSPVNFGPLTAGNYIWVWTTKMHFLAYYISAFRGCCALKFLHTRDWQNYLAHTPTAMGSAKKINPEQINISKIRKALDVYTRSHVSQKNLANFVPQTKKLLTLINVHPNGLFFERIYLGP